MHYITREDDDDEDRDNGVSTSEKSGIQTCDRTRKSLLKEMHESVSRVSGPVSMYLFNVGISVNATNQ
jgi:hypothetical protein